MDETKSTTTSSSTGGQKDKSISNLSKGTGTASFEQPPRRRRILQNFRLIWLDAHIDETNDDFCNFIIHLQRIVNTIDTFIDPDRCVYFLSKIKDEKVFMIVSDTLGQRIVPLVHYLSQLNSIYIYCDNQSPDEQWVKDWSKVKGVFTKIDPICDALKQAARQCDQDSIAINLLPAAQASNKNMDLLDHSFTYTQILKDVLLEIDDYDDQSINDFAAYCREQRADQCKELDDINKFEREYRLKSPIWWYTYEYFLYPMLNRALRNREMDTLINMGFFIRDLHQQIQQLYTEQFGHEQAPTFTVYRGQGLSQKDFDILQKMKGGLLAFNNFLSTSKSSDVSLEFAHNALTDPEYVGILFEMTIDPAVSSTHFADVGQVSCYKEENILFSMHTVFHVRDIAQIGHNNRIWQVELTLRAEDDQQLNALAKRMQQETIVGTNGWHRLGSLLIKLGQSNQAEKVYRMLLDQAHSDSEKAPLYGQLGRIKDNQGDFVEAISFYKESLKNKLKTLPPSHPSFTTTYNNIGMVYHHMGEYSSALSSHRKALENRFKTLPPNHPDLATAYGNIGNVYKNMGEYSKALSFYDRALEVKQKNLPPNLPSLANSYNNIGIVYKNRGEYSNALLCHEKALENRFKTLPPNHPLLASSYNNIASAYYNTGQYSKALSYHEKALETRQKSLRPNHPSLAASYNNIGAVYNRIGEYSKATSFFQRALQIGQISLPPDHPELRKFRRNLDRVKREW